MTDNNDFFGQGDGDRTVFVPRPANNRRDRPAPAAAPAAAPASAPAMGMPQGSPAPAVNISDNISLANTSNIIRSAATPLITLGAHMRSMNHVADSNALFQQIYDDIVSLDKQFQQMDISKEHAITTRYLLCAFIDEMVMSTPWGAQSIWTQKSLLMTFHNNALGGIKFFEIINLLLQNPATNIDMLELCYVMITLGFEGKFRFADGGRYELDRISENLFQVISNQRAEVNKQLSVHGSGLNSQQTLMSDNRLLWFTLTSCVVIALISFCSFFFSINHTSDPIAIQTSAMGSNIEQLVRKPRTSNKKQLLGNISQRLSDDIAKGLVAVNETSDSVKITVSGKGLFKPSSAQISDNRRALMKRIADAIAPEDGSLLIVGHTDNEPIRSLQFPSNWELSTKRAESIQLFLQQQMPNRQMNTEGRADLQPLVPNDTRSNRAINRRIEINLYIS